MAEGYENHVTWNPETGEMRMTRHPVQFSRRHDHYGVLDSNYHGSAELMLKQSTGDWFRFDAFALERLVEDPVMEFCVRLFYNFWSFHCGEGGRPPILSDPIAVRRLVRTVMEKYSFTNVYHNGLHAIEVANSVTCLLSLLKRRELLPLQQDELLVIVLSALAHDIDHPGVNYDYFYDAHIESYFKEKNHVSDVDPSAKDNCHTLYTERQAMTSGKRYLHSMETHQAEFAVSVLLNSGVISSLPDSRRRYLCRMMIDLIESTDMKMHESYSMDMGALASELQYEVQKRTLSEAEKTLVLCHLLKCSDAGNLAKPWQYYLSWARRITEEFFLQGDKERYIRACLNSQKFVTSFCDRDLVDFENSQIGFISFMKDTYIQLQRAIKCSLTDSIVLQMEKNLQRLQMIKKVKSLTGAADSSVTDSKLLLRLLLPTPPEPPSQSPTLRCRLLLPNKQLPSSPLGDTLRRLF